MIEYLAPGEGAIVWYLGMVVFLVIFGLAGWLYWFFVWKRISEEEEELNPKYRIFEVQELMSGTFRGTNTFQLERPTASSYAFRFEDADTEEAAIAQLPNPPDATYTILKVFGF
jgi:hypothetical protein